MTHVRYLLGGVLGLLDRLVDRVFPLDLPPRDPWTDGTDT